jgi:hypothetical protein
MGTFDDQRFYPIANCHFPTLDELAELAGGKPSSDTNHQRRSKHWQDYWAGRRPDYPKSFRYYNKPCSGFFHDAEDLDLPAIWEEYQGGPRGY